MTAAAAPSRPVDEIESGSDRGPRRWPYVVVAVLLVVGVAAVVGDQRRRTAEVDALLATVAAGEESSRWAERRVLGTVQYVEPQFFGPSTRPEVQADLEEIVRSSAGDALVAIEGARAEVEALGILTWHDELEAARDAYAAALYARADHMRAVTFDARALYDSDASIDTVFELARAREALTAATDAARADAAMGR